MFEHSVSEPASARDLADRVVLVVEDDYLIAKELCAVLDVNLLGEHVFSLANELRVRGVPAIFATGYDAEFVPAPFRDSIYLQKPIDITALIRAVKAGARSHSI